MSSPDDADTISVDEGSYTLQNPRPVKLSFRKYGLTYTLLRRDGRVAIYIATGGPCLSDAQGQPSLTQRILSFEVVLIRVSPGGRVFDQVVPPSEHYPSTEEWGRYGFTFADLESATARFEQLQAAEASKTKPTTPDQQPTP